MDKKHISNKEQAVHFLELVASGKVSEAYHKYIGESFIHHNPYFREDANSLMEAMQEDANNNPNKTLEVKQVIEEEQTVVIHSHVKQNSEDLGVALVHIFRFKGEKIVELWDVGQPIPESSQNRIGSF